MPKATVAVAHGQMRNELEGDAVLRRRELDVLVCTTIIEAAWTSPTPTPSSSTTPTNLAWPSSTSCGAAWAADVRAYAYLLYDSRSPRPTAG